MSNIYTKNYKDQRATPAEKKTGIGEREDENEKRRERMGKGNGGRGEPVYGSFGEQEGHCDS